jgi:hypothetical protein
MDLEAFWKRRNAAFDVLAGPRSNDAIKTTSFLGIDPADPRMRLRTAQDGGVKHVRQTDIGNVQTASRNKAARSIRFDAAGDNVRASPTGIGYSS